MEIYSGTKVSCLTNEYNKDEIYIDFYDKNNEIAGKICIDETGKLGWIVWEKEYKEKIESLISDIIGKPFEDTSDYILEAKQPQPIRWECVQDYIMNSGKFINFKQNQYFAETFQNSLKRH